MPKDSRRSKCANSPKSESSDSESDASYSSVSSEDVKVFVKHRHSKKNSDKARKHSDKARKHSDKARKHSDKARKCKKESESESESESEKHSEHKSEKSDSSSESEKKCKKYCFEEIYKYYKYRLLTDDCLMVAGSDAYTVAYNTTVQNIPSNQPVTYNNNGIQYNVEHLQYDSPFCVREGGIYIIFAIASVEQASQFTIFVNGVANVITITGNNAGGGQTVSRHMLALNKDDTVVFRNYTSNASALVANVNIGGVQVGNNITFLLMKIAALPNKEYMRITESWSHECLSKHKLYLYKKVLDKMLHDKELMLKGFDVHGSFYTQVTQTVPTESNVVFTNFVNVNGLLWDASNPDRVQILEDGVYKTFFMVTTNTSCQFTICVNDVPVDATTQGTNKGAGQLSTRYLLELKKGDFLTVKNHTSLNGSTVISQNAGGSLLSASALLTVFKVAPLCKPCVEHCKLNEYHRKSFEKFRCFLLHNKCLQITGSSAYFNYATSTTQTLAVGDPYLWEITTLQKEICHKQCTTSLVIERDGIYDIFADVITAEPSQITLFVNGTPDLETTCGRDSGANRTIMRQFVRLTKGDTVEVKNYSSLSTTITTTLNSGGSQPGHPCFFMAFMLAPIDDENCLKPKKCKK
jgi:hypothetical protein